MEKSKMQFRDNAIPKTPAGIQELDEVTSGGLLKGRTTLVCRNASCGKTLFAKEFIVRGSKQKMIIPDHVHLELR